MEIDEYAMLGEQDIFVSEEFGELKFVPSVLTPPHANCKHCILWDNSLDDCQEPTALCRSWERNDRKDGYFVKNKLNKDTIMEEYTKKGLSTDQNTFLSKKWGKVTFVPASNGAVRNTCRHCILWDNKWGFCQEKTAPCCSWERDDMKNGYFTIHEFPKEKNGI